jgi:antitoxin ParD1/3/4
MTKTVSIDLNDQLGAFVEAQIAEGRYDSPSEVLRASLKLLEERETRLSALRAALIEGEESGIAEGFDFDDFIAEMKATKG